MSKIFHSRFKMVFEVLWFFAIVITGLYCSAVQLTWVFWFWTDGLFHRRLGEAKADEPSQFQKLMTDFQGFFDADEEAGPDVLADFATIMNKGLRRKPNDEAIKTAMAKFKFPANIPNM